MDFGTKPEAKPCGICKNIVNLPDKIVVEREISALIKLITYFKYVFFYSVHKQCFKCAYCNAELKQGACAMNRTPVGLRWYCSGIGTKQCSLVPNAEKEAKLKGSGGAKAKAKK